MDAQSAIEVANHIVDILKLLAPYVSLGVGVLKLTSSVMNAASKARQRRVCTSEREKPKMFGCRASKAGNCCTGCGGWR